jgi:hypothetical protein
VGAEGLERVVEDGGVAALLEAGEQFFEIAGRLIADAGEIGDGKEFERSFSGIHGNSS